MNGRVVNTILDEEQNSGIYFSNWDGTDYFGNISPPGIYFYQLKSGRSVLSKKMVLQE